MHAEPKADVESKDKSQKTPLIWAAHKGHLDVVKFLEKEAGADVEAKDLRQMTPLSYAAANGHLDVVKFLVEEAGAGADVESKDRDGKTALDVARQGYGKTGGGGIERGAGPWRRGWRREGWQEQQAALERSRLTDPGLS